ncbi:MAG: hypothetical protein WC438_05305 [Candidatus Pacearchaeota archaeon]
MNPIKLKQELEKAISPELVKELFYEFEKTKSAHWLGDIDKTITHSAKFSEIAIASLKKISNPKGEIDLNDIKFKSIYNQLLNLPKSSPKEELLFLLIPNVLDSIYSIRNKKRVVHIKLNNADSIDAELVMTGCNWVFSQFVFLYYTKDINEVVSLTNSLMERKVPTLEKFEDGEIMILKKGLKFSEELLLILYQFPKRLSVKELNGILKPTKSSYITTYLKNLYKDRLIHLNSQGAIINKNGINKIENDRNKFFN